MTAHVHEEDVVSSTMDIGIIIIICMACFFLIIFFCLGYYLRQKKSISDNIVRNMIEMTKIA